MVKIPSPRRLFMSRSKTTAGIGGGLDMCATTLDIDDIPFADLLLILLPPEEAAAASGDHDDDEAEDGRRRRLLATVWAALGPGGAGLLAVSGVPRAASLRRRLLPLARRLALMDHPSRAHLLKKHGLGSDVPLNKPDRSVSSFARLLRHDSGKLRSSPEEVPDAVDGFGQQKGDDDIENLGELFEELGLLRRSCVFAKPPNTGCWV